MNALHRIHAALVPGGLVVDTQPVSPRPTVRAHSGDLGHLDMRGWLEIVEAVDERAQQVLDSGLFAIEAEHRFVVADTFETGTGLGETVKGWQGTRLPPALGARLARHAGSAEVRQEVRLRLLRAR